MRLVDVEPIIEGWKKSGNSKKAEAKALMNSGIYSEYEKGVALDCVADLVLALAEHFFQRDRGRFDCFQFKQVVHWVSVHKEVADVVDGK